MKWVLAAVLALGSAGGGCVTEARIEERYVEKVEQWYAANPEALIDEETKLRLWSEAAREVEEEVARDREKAKGHAQGLLGAAVSGNIPALVFGAVGLLGLGVPLLKKAKGLRPGKAEVKG